MNSRESDNPLFYESNAKFYNSLAIKTASNELLIREKFLKRLRSGLEEEKDIRQLNLPSFEYKEYPLTNSRSELLFKRKPKVPIRVEIKEKSRIVKRKRKDSRCF